MAQVKAVNLKGLGRLWSIQGHPSIMLSGMIETLHGIDSSFKAVNVVAHLHQVDAKWSCTNIQQQVNHATGCAQHDVGQ